MELSSLGAYDCNDSNKSGTIFVIVYPWVCNLGDEDASAYWGGMGNYKYGLPWGPDLTPKVNCYYDNEPWDILNQGSTVPGTGKPYYPHSMSTAIPPVWQAYKFVKMQDSDDQIYGWLLKEKLPDGTLEDYAGSDNGFVLKYAGQEFPY